MTHYDDGVKEMKRMTVKKGDKIYAIDPNYEGVKHMTNLEKMNELMRTKVDKKQIIDWAYMNRIHVGELALEKEFESMFNSVEDFCNSQTYEDGFIDEFEMWDSFLDREFTA